jgi:radical SAM protein with 4Fe4S-binding SPASM domain
MNGFLRLTPHCSLKKLEKPYIYDIKNDELYEIDDKAEELIKKCDGKTPFQLVAAGFSLRELTPPERVRLPSIEEAEFVNFCLKENLLEIVERPHSSHVSHPSSFVPRQSPIPSLRYLELQLTAKCNLSCRHCYLGKPKNIELSLDSVKKILREFEEMQGLRLLISGGEPMLYSKFWELNDMLPDYNFRKVLLTNGWFLEKDEASRLNVHEVQVSLDGLEESHDVLRGNGSFKRAVTAMDAVKNAEIDLSVATMVHRYNLYDFPMMAEMIKGYSVKEWGIDVPLQSGNLKSPPTPLFQRGRGTQAELGSGDFVVSPEEGAERLKFAFGGSYHGGSEGYACGRHLCTIMPTGSVCKCGFYEDNPLGHISEGLRMCWERNYHIPLKELECYGCEYIAECQGGCRFRSDTPTSPDPIMCALYK